MKHFSRFWWFTLVCALPAFAQTSNETFGDFSDSGTELSPSSLESKCSHPGYACGECESNLQTGLNDILRGITTNFPQTQNWGGDQTLANRFNRGPNNIALKPDATLEGTLSKIMDLFRSNNPGGDSRLNFVVIGQSESLQGTSVKDGKLNPRVMLKSPNSELMVTFNTDPKSPGYKTLEVMRWNGRLGRYEFQEINFGNKKVDLSGSRCMECHKEPSMRPNWDTYRAWAGVIPSRDDMLESNPHNRPGNTTTEEGLDPKSGAQPDARAYLNFLDQVVEAKEKHPRSRLAMLDIPFDDTRQLGAYVTAAGKTRDQLSPREKVEMIRRRVAEEGFYRIRHFPDPMQSEAAGGLAVNLDSKTAKWAGPSQMAFDQMSAQNMCRIVTDLRTHPEFPKFGKALAYLYACQAESSNPNLDAIFPQNFKDKVISYFNSTNFSSLADLERDKRPKSPVRDVDELRTFVRADTDRSHSQVDEFKIARHSRLLRNYLQNAERKSSTDAARDAEFYTRTVMTPMQSYFHAIEDPGGVKGVAESSGAIVSETRMLLESFGVPVNHWSLARGRDNAYNSFSFSDQFELMTTQPFWAQMKNQAGGCAKLAEQAKKDLEGATAPKAMAESIVIPDPSTYCKGVATQPTSGTEVFSSGVLDATSKVLLPQVRASMAKCLTCHTGVFAPEFTGLEKFVNNRGDNDFINFVANSRSTLYNRPFIEVIQMKLGLTELPPGGEMGSPMPPSEWGDNAEYARKMGVSEEEGMRVRRRMIASVLTNLASKKNSESYRLLCEGVNTSSENKASTSLPASTKSSGVKPQ